MKGMLTKDLLLWRKLLPGYLCLLLIQSASSIIGSIDWLMFIVPLNIFFMLTTAVLDIWGGWSRVTICFPMERKALVTSRYAAAVIVTGISLLTVVFNGIIATLFFGMGAAELLYAAGFAVMLCFLYAAVGLFLCYLPKTDNGKAVTWILNTSVLIGNFFAVSQHFFTKLRANINLTTLVIMVLASAVLLLISWAASVRIFEKRDL